MPDTLDWDLWLGGAAARPFTAGDEEYTKFVAERNARSGRGGGGGGAAAAGSASTCRLIGAVFTISAAA